MIVITGAAGFIGSCLVAHLNTNGHNDLLLVDNKDNIKKHANLIGIQFSEYIERDDFVSRFAELAKDIDFVFHLGARTDTTLMDTAEFDRWNVGYSQAIWTRCTEHAIPLIYASSAATYGLGDLGFSDDHDVIPELEPLNPYGESKQQFDLWVLGQTKTPPFWAGLKFFNVYGPNEYHKGRMASVVFHAFVQIYKKHKMQLFRSHNPDFPDGGQMRDFIYVKDLLDVLLWLMENKPASGIYNLGTGDARTFADLAFAVFDALEKEPNITFIDTPEDIRDKYQYFTEAEMDKLRIAGYRKPFTTLEEGVKDYVTTYLKENMYFSGKKIVFK